MNSTTTTSNNRNINEITSDSTQSFIAQNKIAVFTVIGLIVAAIVGFGLFKQFGEKSQAAYNTKIYTFETTVLKDYLAKPADAVAAKTLENGIQNLHLEMGNYVGLLPVVIKASDALVANSHFAEARSILMVGGKVSNDDYSDYFIESRQAVVYEDMGEDKLAIDTLEKMTSKSVKVFEGKTYLDLGRLYLKTGNKEKAKANFKYVIEKAKDESEFVKIANLYLATL
ncbi:MAG: tetratricopeptide repeat protein [Bacteriovorax sp.]|nr:tetratricopeptide repeat protein [Bacteriovorax sp.]